MPRSSRLPASVAAAAIAAISVLVFATVVSAQTYSVLHTFPAPGPVTPNAPLIQASDGNFYGTTSFGGVSDQGAVFQMNAAGTVTILHEFLGAPASGQSFAALVQAADGNLYGTTWDGGANDKGSIFKMTLGGVFTMLHSFDAATHGANPSSALIIGIDGSFYGTTSVGGASGLGTVFKFTLPGTFTVLHAFAGGASDGASPYAPLVQASDGALYGTTRDGGASSLGTVFKVSLPGGAVTLLHSFAGSNGRYPMAGLIQATDGFLYGTTFLGGGSNLGTVFRISTAGALVVLKAFAGGADSREPVAALIQKPDGNFYGTTRYQGATPSYYGGRVFEMTPGGTVTSVHDFNNADGGVPTAALVRAADGHFYGTTSRGGTAGAAGAGTTFRITSGGSFTLLHSFDGGTEGARPAAPLIRGTDGNLYGTAVTGGHADWGVIFRMTPAGAMTHLHSFDAVTDSNNPQSTLVQGTDGDFYGGIQPVLYKITAGGTFTTLRILNADTEGDGANTLIQAADGNFYGTTNLFGLANKGTLFKMTPDGTVTLLRTFTGGIADGDAPSPRARLVQGADGSLYGTTVAGGASNLGTIFKITTTGTFTLLHSFVGATEGSAPQAPLILASDGNFWGTTSTGGPGPGSAGVVFKMTPAGSVTVVHAFTGNTNDGASPYSGLVQAPTGTFYGTTSLGGVSHAGTVFSLTPAGAFAVEHSFTGGSGGSGPITTPTLAPGGHLYGTTFYGGITTGLGMGVVFHLTIPGLSFTDDPLTPTVTLVKAVHVTELRSRIDGVRAAHGLGGFSWGPALVPGATIRAQLTIDLRTALDQAYTAAGLTPPAYTDPALGIGTPIKAVHIAELRSAVLAIE